jgi:hypothetical protein
MKTPEYSRGAMRHRRAAAAWNASCGSREWRRTWEGEKGGAGGKGT